MPEKNEMKSNTKRLLLTLALFLIPVLLLGNEFGQQRRRPPSLTQFWFTTKYGLLLLTAIVGTILIWFNKMKRPVRIVLMGLAFILFGGIIIGIHPSPVCASTKPFLFGLRTNFLAMLLFVGITTILANKSFCGAACPGGALQELLYWMPILKKRKKKIPFKLSNTIRIVIAGVFFIVAFAAGITIFEYVNYFELFHWSFPAKAVVLIAIFVPLIVFSFLALFIYRPYCYFACPMGLATWVVEQLSLSRVKLDKEKCTECNICVDQSPCPAVEGIIAEKTIRADCHLCGECINVCPEKALSFGIRGK